MSEGVVVACRICGALNGHWTWCAETERLRVARAEDEKRAARCARGEHEDSGAWVSASDGALFASESGSPLHGKHIRVLVCRHCRGLYVPRST